MRIIDYSGKMRTGSRFKERKLSDVKFSDFGNPWTFYCFFSADQYSVLKWMQNVGLIAADLPCTVETCKGIMKIAKRKNKFNGATLRCTCDRNHETSVTHNSIFDKHKVCIQDFLNFIVRYLEKQSLLHCSITTGICYKSTGVRMAKLRLKRFGWTTKVYNYKATLN